MTSWLSARTLIDPTAKEPTAFCTVEECKELKSSATRSSPEWKSILTEIAITLG